MNSLQSLLPIFGCKETGTDRQISASQVALVVKNPPAMQET